jgi:FKBP-type peptidyl-prolyl cis-trans isomerase FkpA
MLTARPLKMLQLSDDEIDLVLRGIEDTARGEPLPIDPEEFASKLRLLQEERRKAGLEIEAKESGEYLVAQSKLEGAEATPSGLIFTEIEVGNGSQPTATNTVRVKYTGRLRDGTIFDERTAEFPLNGVIPCWTEGVARVKVGGKARLVCPSEIAYGNNGMPPIIPPGAALTFDVELLEIIE